MRSIAATCKHGADAQVDGIAHAVVRLSPKAKSLAHDRKITRSYRC